MEIIHPNRSKPIVISTRFVVILLLLITAGLMAIVTFAGWPALQGAKPEAVVYIAIYLILAFYALRWKRGILPVSAALAIILAILAGVSAPGWFARDKAGFTQPHISANVLGAITLIIIPVQILLIAFTMRAFQHGWNVEEERPLPGHEDWGPQPSPA